MNKPIFYKRHYILLAQLLQQNNYTVTADEMIKVFRTDNPNFDEQRFKKALNAHN